MNDLTLKSENKKILGIQEKISKNLAILVLLLFSVQFTFGQNNYHDQFTEYCSTHDTTAQLRVLQLWENSNPNDPELFTSYFNYYFQLSKYNMLNIDSKSGDQENLQIKDSSDQVMGFLVEKTYYKPELLDKGFDWINNGIEKFPARLDMRFGKVYALGQIEDWYGFTAEITESIQYSDEISNKWLWTKNKPVDDAEIFFLGSIQGYQSQLYNTEEDSLLENMREISEQILKIYPNHFESLSNIAVTYMMTGQYREAIPPLLAAEKIAPTDNIVLSNLAYAYKLNDDSKLAIIYYKKLLEIGDAKIKRFAQKQIDLLEE